MNGHHPLVEAADYRFGDVDAKRGGFRRLGQCGLAAATSPCKGAARQSGGDERGALRITARRVEGTLREPEESTPATSERVFRLGLPSALDICITPVLLPRLAAEAPGMKLVIRPIDAQTGPGKLDSGDVDLGLSHFLEVERWHRKQEVAPHNFACIYDGQRQKAPTPITLKAYLAVDHVLPSFSGDFTGDADEALARNGHKRRVVARLGISHRSRFIFRQPTPSPPCRPTQPGSLPIGWGSPRARCLLLFPISSSR